MKQINLCFQGWIRNCDLESVKDIDGNKISTESMSTQELERKLNEGEVFISLCDLLVSGSKQEVELHDFEIGE